MKLYLAAKRYADNPADVEALTRFMEALAEESSIEDIAATIALGSEDVTGAALSRVADLLPSDVDLLLSIALWRYHLGLDEDAHQSLRKAKSIAFSDRRVLQTEILMNYGNGPDHILSLCRAALSLYPDDEWILATRSRVEQTGQLNQLVGPNLNLRWQKVIFSTI